MSIKIFQMNDCDWMAGETLGGCIAEYALNYDGHIDREEFEPCEVPDAKLDRLSFDYDGEDSVDRTFRQQLQFMIERGDKFPTFFASTEF